MSDPSPVLVCAEELTFDDDTGTLRASRPDTASSENPPLTVNQIIAILSPSPSAQPVILGLIEDADNKDVPLQLVAIQTSGDVPAQLASVPRVAQLPTHLAHAASVDYVLSTGAGTGRAVPFWEAVLRPLLRFVAQSLSQDTEPARVVVTESDDSIREYARGEHLAAA
ncbi:hypothetical protein LLEC1_07460, partial [Akanthomyces lecanii]